jgi:23S rRNA (guanosine2251-2'-O)-methyltransferase
MSEKKLFTFGLHAVEALLKQHPDRIINLTLLQDRQDKKLQTIAESARKHNIRIEFVNRQTLDRLTDNANHQGAIAFTHVAKKQVEHDLEDILENLQEPAFLLILDGVQDPHNLGAILRTADAAGVHAVIAPKDKAVGITATVSKVACGAAEVVPFIQVTNLARTIEELKAKNIWIYGAAGEAESTVYQTKLKGSVAVVMGAEGAGLRRLTRELCDVLLKIPMQGSVSSLNVSVATGVFLFEIVRQRQLT